ncbi:hypothetical protein LP419_31730 [Massilia sp. H-1]|nr:hypothetical protein LP419_31730 [Massilia sp. H-1]
MRGSVLCHPAEDDAMLRALYRVLEARAADDALCLGCCPARARPLAALRAFALRARPPLLAFAPPLQPLESLVRAVLLGAPDGAIPAGSVPGVDTRCLQLPRPAPLR